MTDIEFFEECSTDVVNGEMSIHAYTMVAKGLVLALEAELTKLQKDKTCDGCKYNRFGCDSIGQAVDCTIGYGYACSRGAIDRYEPKDKE